MRIKMITAGKCEIFEEKLNAFIKTIECSTTEHITSIQYQTKDCGVNAYTALVTIDSQKEE